MNPTQVQPNSPKANQEIRMIKPEPAASRGSSSSSSGFVGFLRVVFWPVTLIVDAVRAGKSNNNGNSNNGTTTRVTTPNRETSKPTPTTSKGNKPTPTTSNGNKPTPTTSKANKPTPTTSKDSATSTTAPVADGRVDGEDTFDPARPDLQIGKDIEGNRIEKWTENGVEHTRIVYGEEDYLETWIEGGFKWTKRETPEDIVVNKTNEGLRITTVTTVRNGQKIVSYFDEQGNELVERREIYGEYVPDDPWKDLEPSKPILDNNKNNDTGSHVKTNHTPAELKTEVNNQFNEWNRYRNSQGLRSGVWDESIANEAQKWADKLAKDDNGTGRIYDTTPHERQYVKATNDPTYNFVEVNAGENVWMTDAYNLQKSLTAFKNSKYHNENLLLAEEKGTPIRIGIGISKGTGKDWNGRTPYYVVYKMAY